MGIIVVEIAVIGFLTLLLFRPFHHTHTVVLRADAFHPAQLTVRPGDSVLFTTDIGESFWPASNLHPSHEIYPDFDPKKPIDENASWRFTFTRDGMWRYHDHLHPNYQGTVTVANKKFSLFSPRILKTAEDWNVEEVASACASEEMDRKQQCWDNALINAVKDRGLAAAFDLFSALYKTDPSVAKGCHGWGHVLGKEAYRLYAEKKDLNIPKEAGYCGYGFYHGFLEEMLRLAGNLDETITFCRFASDRADPRDAGSVYSNCIHGIGHGSTAGAAELPENQGNVEAVLAAGKKNCGLVTANPEELQVCWEGAFNELQQNINFATNGFSYEMINDDFFGICRREEEKYKKACYFEFIGLIAHFTTRDFRKSVAMVLEDISDHETASYLIVKLAADFMQDDIVHPSWDSNIRDCRSLPEYLRVPCVNGIMLGFSAHGEPGEEYVKALSFCRGDLLTVDERDLCYRNLFGGAVSSYPPEKIAQICTTVEVQYQKYCRR